MKVRFKKILPGAKVPVYSSEFAAGADLCACVEESVTVKSGESVMLPTGSPSSFRGTVGLVFARSGLASKRSLAPANKVGVIDCDYRGEIKVALFNHGSAIRPLSPESG
ncbi:MAG: dUTP diphosphatase [Lachnospiraceae bacterium]